MSNPSSHNPRSTGIIATGSTGNSKTHICTLWNRNAHHSFATMVVGVLTAHGQQGKTHALWLETYHFHTRDRKTLPLSNLLNKPPSPKMNPKLPPHLPHSARFMLLCLSLSQCAPLTVRTPKTSPSYALHLELALLLQACDQAQSKGKKWLRQTQKLKPCLSQPISFQQSASSTWHSNLL